MRYPRRDKEGVDMTSERGGWVIGSIEEFSKNVTLEKTASMCIRRVATITLMKSRITEEDTLCGFG